MMMAVRITLLKHKNLSYSSFSANILKDSLLHNQKWNLQVED
jgi:hypothetical protein